MSKTMDRFAELIREFAKSQKDPDGKVTITEAATVATLILAEQVERVADATEALVALFEADVERESAEDRKDAP